MEYQLIESDVPFDGQDLPFDGAELGMNGMGNKNFIAAGSSATEITANVQFTIRNLTNGTKIIAFGAADFGAPETLASVVSGKTVDFNAFGRAVLSTANGCTLLATDQDLRTFAADLRSGSLVIKTIQTTVLPAYTAQASANPVYVQNSFISNPITAKLNAAAGLNQYALNNTTNLFDVNKVIGNVDFITYQLNPSIDPATSNFNDVTFAFTFSYLESAERALAQKVKQQVSGIQNRNAANNNGRGMIQVRRNR